jgi:hypothetical protein
MNSSYPLLQKPIFTHSYMFVCVANVVEKKPKKKSDKYNNKKKDKKGNNKSDAKKRKPKQSAAPVQIRPIRRIRPEVSVEFGKDL